MLKESSNHRMTVVVVQASSRNLGTGAPKTSFAFVFPKMQSGQMKDRRALRKAQE